MTYMDQVHLPEWTFDQKRILGTSVNSNLDPNPKARSILGVHSPA